MDSADIKPPGFSFGIRLPNGLAPSFPRPEASVSHSKIRFEVVTFLYGLNTNSHQKRAGEETSPLCSSTIRSKGKYASIDAMVTKVESREDYKEHGK